MLAHVDCNSAYVSWERVAATFIASSGTSRARWGATEASSTRSSSTSTPAFVFGGLTGVILASPPLDFHLHDSYFVVAHFHFVVFGTVVFAMFSGFYFWWPKFTGRSREQRRRALRT